MSPLSLDGRSAAEASEQVPDPAHLSADAKAAIAARRSIFSPAAPAVAMPRIGIALTPVPPTGALAASERVQALQLAVTRSAVQLRRADSALERMVDTAPTRGKFVAIVVGIVALGALVAMLGVALLGFGLSMDLSGE